MDLKIPSSIIGEYISFKIKSTIGPSIIPITPIVLYPVYIAIKVKIGCIPICLLTNFGSNKFLTTPITDHNAIIKKPSKISPFKASIIAQGTITAPEPTIGSASTKAIPRAVINGYGTFNLHNLKITSPTREIANEINIKIAYAFK